MHTPIPASIVPYHCRNLLWRESSGLPFVLHLDDASGVCRVLPCARRRHQSEGPQLRVVAHLRVGEAATDQALRVEHCVGGILDTETQVPSRTAEFGRVSLTHGGAERKRTPASECAPIPSPLLRFDGLSSCALCLTAAAWFFAASPMSLSVSLNAT